MRELNEKCQLVLPHIHHINSVERVIRTFKEHFISRLDSTHKELLLRLWCQLLPHASLTLNLLRKLRMNLKNQGMPNFMGNLTTMTRHYIRLEHK